MVEALAVLVCVGIYLFAQTKSKASPAFDWVKFWAFLGMFAVFTVGYVLPLAMNQALMDKHPALQAGLLLGGVVVFVIGITMWGLKRKRMLAGQ